MAAEPPPEGVEAPRAEVPRLETERLILRQLRPDDAADMFEYASDPQVARFVSWREHRTLEETAAVIDYLIDQTAETDLPNWAIEDKASGKMIGMCGFVREFPERRRGVVGYSLHQDYWGGGLMPEAAAAVLRYGFVEKGYDSIAGGCDVRNPQSERVMQKLGLHFERSATENIRGEIVHSKIYAIGRDEYFFWEAYPGPQVRGAIDQVIKDSVESGLVPVFVTGPDLTDEDRGRLAAYRGRATELGFTLDDFAPDAERDNLRVAPIQRQASKN